MENNYFNLEAKLIDKFKSQFLGQKVITKTSEVGSIVNISGNLFDYVTLCVQFPTEQKKYCVEVAIKSGYLTFETSDLMSIYQRYKEAHSKLTSEYNQLQVELRQLEINSSQEESDKLKAEESYQRAKERALKKFEEHTYRTQKTTNQSEDFFYSLGWLAKHIGTISATLPDYLDSAFIKYFGADVTHRVIDSRKKTSNGHPMQYSWSFKATLPGVVDVPESLEPHLNAAKTMVTDTSFIWDLVDTYNFKFGREQDIHNILTSIPLSYKNIFKAGFES